MARSDAGTGLRPNGTDTRRRASTGTTGRSAPSRRTLYDAQAAPVFDLLERLETLARGGASDVVDAAVRALAAFERAALEAGAPRPALKPARYALALLIDQAARANTQITLSTWSVLARQKLFEGRDISLARIRDFRATATGAGPEFDDLAAFLDGVMDRLEDVRKGHRQGATRPTGWSWGWIAAGYAVLLVAGLVLYSGYLEVRFHRGISAEFDRQVVGLGLDVEHTAPEQARRLNALRDATEQAREAAQRAPLRRAIRLPLVDSELRAEATYRAAVAAWVPGLVGGAIEQVLANSGEGLALYDALRAWSVLVADEAWQPGYLEGWLDANAADLGLPGLEAHIAALDGPDPEVVPSDAEVMAQARRFAAETSETDRAWLELLRADATRALPRWSPDAAVPGLADVAVTRSGVPLAQGLPGIFTQAGFDWARDFGVGVAVRDAREIGPRITGATLPSQNAAPDLVLDRLNVETIAAWQAWLEDLRVRPFRSRQQALIVSGALDEMPNPLTDLIEEVWAEAGGLDRRRNFEQQQRVTNAFSAAIQYVENDSYAEIARLFAGLNRALGTADFNEARAMERLMTAADRRRSIDALTRAPAIIVQIAEDVLAQSARPQAEEGQGRNALTRQWQQVVYPMCRNAIEGRYPFGEGADADPGDVAALLGRGGTLTAFAEATAATLIDTSASPWRWKPEARFEGFQPESAAYFEQALVIGAALFGEAGQLDRTLSLAALAERGQTSVAIGGAGAPVRTRGAPAQLSWPGPVPEQGVEVSFREGTDAARLIHPGPWGLIRLADGTRVRLRDGGATALLDLRGEGGRVFMELGFDAALNPLSARNVLRDFGCPPVL